MIVMKFGGTSVGSAERIRGVSDLVGQRLDRKPVVVVSALSKITDLLIKGARLSLEGDAAAQAIPAEVLSRHVVVIEDLVPAGAARDALVSFVEGVVEELRTLYTGVSYLGELTPRSLDAISGMGERLSCEIVAAAMLARGVPARSLDSREIMLTDDTFGRAQPLMQETSRRVSERIGPVVAEGVVPILGGFIGRTKAGIGTTLGRGGSDWTAAIYGSLLPAEEIQIWTDVDGMMTLDPRAFPAAKVIRDISFDEAAELSYFGAKVLHPATIKPAVERNIPVRILNSMNPLAPGTLITSRSGAPAGEPRAIAFKRGITVLLISQPKMLMAHGFVSSVFDVFQKHRTSVDLIATSEVSISLTVDDAAALPVIEADLARLGEVRILGGMAIVSVVGRGFLTHPGLACRVFKAVGDVNVVMISFGASDVNLSLVVAEADALNAVRRLHQEFFGAGPAA